MCGVCVWCRGWSLELVRNNAESAIRRGSNCSEKPLEKHPEPFGVIGSRSEPLRNLRNPSEVIPQSCRSESRVTFSGDSVPIQSDMQLLGTLFGIVGVARSRRNHWSLTRRSGPEMLRAFRMVQNHLVSSGSTSNYRR